MSIEDKIKVDKDLEAMTVEWKKRKKLFKNIWDTITEAMPGSSKDFMEELGIETDEMVGVHLDGIPR